MGDYGGNWRYNAATDGRRAGSTPTKRSRRDYGLWFFPSSAINVSSFCVVSSSTFVIVSL